MNASLLAQLKKRLSTSEEVDVSRYQFVNLDTVQRAAGPRWSNLRRRAFLATRSHIERRVSSDDLIVQCATGFLVIYAKLTGEAASSKTAEITQGLETFFLGEEGLAKLQVKASTAPMSFDGIQAALADSDIAIEEMEPDAPPTLPSTDAATGNLSLAAMKFNAIWDAQREAVASYFARPVSDIEQNAGWTPDLSNQLGRADDRLNYDLEVLEAAAGALGQLIASGSRCALVVPAGFANLAQPITRSKYITAIASLPAEIRALVWLRIEDAPYDAPIAHLEETGRIVARRVGQVFLHARLTTPSFDGYSHSQANWIGADLPSRYTAGTRAEMDHFLALAQRHGLPTYFDRCDHWEHARSASRLGARLLAGAAVGTFDMPRAPYRLTRAALLARAA